MHKDFVVPTLCIMRKSTVSGEEPYIIIVFSDASGPAWPESPGLDSALEGSGV